MVSINGSGKALGSDRTRCDIEERQATYRARLEVRLEHRMIVARKNHLHFRYCGIWLVSEALIQLCHSVLDWCIFPLLSCCRFLAGSGSGSDDGGLAVALASAGVEALEPDFLSDEREAHRLLPPWPLLDLCEAARLPNVLLLCCRGRQCASCHPGRGGGGDSVGPCRDG